jgi:hypothetical protein
MCDNAENKLDSTLNYSTECAGLDMSIESPSKGIEKDQLQEQLSKFIELVPHLKEINSTERIKNILADPTNLTQNLENLDINSKGISDLQILQSIMDYIMDLQDKAYN